MTAPSREPTADQWDAPEGRTQHDERDARIAALEGALRETRTELSAWFTSYDEDECTPEGWAETQRVLALADDALASAPAPHEPDAVAAAKERVVEVAKEWLVLAEDPPRPTPSTGCSCAECVRARRKVFDALLALRAAEQADGRREDV